MHLIPNVRIHLFIIVIIHAICITCNPQYGYSEFNNKINNQRRRNSEPTKHPNAHFSRLVNNDLTKRNPRKDNNKDLGRTFGNHRPLGSVGFPHSLHPHHSIHQGHHAFNQAAYQYPQQQYTSPQTASNPCNYRRNGRNAGKSNNNKESARFLWDLNVYNVYPGQGGRPHRSGCDDELYSDADNAPQAQTSSPGVFSNFVSLFSHGGALNPFGSRPSVNRGPIRPYRPSYRPPPTPIRPIAGSDNGIGSGGDAGSNGDNGDIYDAVFENNNNNNNINNDRPVYENQYEDQYNEVRDRTRVPALRRYYS